MTKDEDLWKAVAVGAGIALGLMALKKFLDSLEDDEYE